MSKTLFRNLVAAACAVATAIVFGSCSSDSDEQSDAAGPGHVHSVTIDPTDGSLLLAGHYGLFRVDQSTSDRSLTRVGNVGYDFMGFTVGDDGQYLGSGHPPPSDPRPPHLGLIGSTDAGATWGGVSLEGEADFHLLASQGAAVYGADSLSGRFFASSDGGRTWARTELRGAPLSIAPSPEKDGEVLVSTTSGTNSTSNGGRSFEQVDDDAAVLDWGEDGIYRTLSTGQVQWSDDPDAGWKPRGELPLLPVALESGRGMVFAVLSDGSVHSSSDGARTWAELFSPQALAP